MSRAWRFVLLFTVSTLTLPPLPAAGFVFFYYELLDINPHHSIMQQSSSLDCVSFVDRFIWVNARRVLD